MITEMEVTDVLRSLSKEPMFIETIQVLQLVQHH